MARIHWSVKFPLKRGQKLSTYVDDKGETVVTVHRDIALARAQQKTSDHKEIDVDEDIDKAEDLDVSDDGTKGIKRGRRI